MRLYTLASFATAALTLVLGQTDIECPSADLTSYLLQVIDGLYANGLTTLEALLAHITAHDAGYDLLASIFADHEQTYTLLAPTDAAWQMAGVWAPFEQQDEGWLVDLFSLHVIKGEVGYAALPEKGNGIVETMVRLGPPNHARSNESAAMGEEGKQRQKAVLKRGDGGTVLLKTAKGDVTSWDRAIELSWLELVDNLVILPIDHVLDFPPDVPAVLGLPTSTRSSNGLRHLRAAIENVSATGAQELAKVTPGGLTLFAPVDDAWTDAAWAQAGDTELGARLLGNHYSINQTVFSPSWLSNSGGARTGAGMTMMTGQQLIFSVEGETSYVSLGEQRAQILRPDVVLENGVLHIIDKVLLVPDTESSTAETTLEDPFFKTTIVTPTEAPAVQAPTPSVLTPEVHPPAKSAAVRDGSFVSTVCLAAVAAMVARWLTAG